MDAPQTDEGVFPDENPNRPREYHGRRTLAVGVLVMGAVALALWLALRGEGLSTGDAFGPADLPRYLNPGQRPVAVAAGALAPDFELETLDGGRFRLSDWRGHPVVLNFWASWCPPCRREIPVLVRLQRQYREAGLVVAGVNIEEARRSAAAFRDEFSIDFILPMDFGGGVTRRYEVVGPPNSIFVRPDGVIDTIFVGQAPDDTFEEQVAALMTTLDEVVGAEPLPGPKALPLRFNPDGIPEAPTVGAPTPDFLAQRLDGGEAWRLSDNLAAPLILLFSPPGCLACSAEAAAVARAGGYPTAILIEEDAAVPAEHVALRWRGDVGAAFEVDGEFRAVVIGGDAIVRGVAGAAADLPAVLAVLE